MLTPVEKIVFLFLATISLYFTRRFFRQMIRIIRRGEGSLYVADVPARLWRALEITVSQRTVFRTRLSTSLMHGFVAWGFLFYFLINAGDLIEGYIDAEFLGTGILGGLYRLIGDVLSVFIIVGVVYFLIRRFLINTLTLQFRDNVKMQPKVRSGLKRDSLLVGLFILVHVGARFMGETFWVALHEGDAWQPFAAAVAGQWDNISHGALETSEHVMWWLALGTVLAFVPYFPYTKHAHLFMGPINYFSRPVRISLGALDPLDFEDEDREQFGASRLEHLTKTQLLDSFACIMCNRCQEACPAYVTGKELSPAALEINKRYEIKQQMSAFAAGEPSVASLLDFAISTSAVWACTTCGACIEICPVGNEPMFDILDIRRDQVLTQGEFPHELLGAFRGMENNGNPWQMGESRMAWAKGLNVPTVEDTDDFEVLFWVGCAGAFDPGAQQTARALVRILHAARVKFAVLGEAEICTGDSARRAGNEYLFYEMALMNIETLNELDPPRIMTMCPHCFHTISNEYPQFGGQYEVVHYAEFINELLQEGRLKFDDSKTESVTYHDPCYLGRHNGVFDEPRFVLGAAGVAVIEMARTGKNAFCCGAGGSQFWKEEEQGAGRVSIERYNEATQTGSAILAVSCPFCLRMFTDASQDEETVAELQVKDVAEIVAERLRLAD